MRKFKKQMGSWIRWSLSVLVFCDLRSKVINEFFLCLQSFMLLKIGLFHNSIVHKNMYILSCYNFVAIIQHFGENMYNLNVCVYICI